MALNDPIPLVWRWTSAVFLVMACLSLSLVNGHGRLFDPPSRATAWRVGFNTPKDFTDMEGDCGGFERQWKVNNGKCGICGDPFDAPIKAHGAPGGLYATGTIVRRYTQGQIIPVTIQITATHKGFYEFKLCPNNNVKQDPDQECFERFKMRFVDDGNKTRYFLNNLKAATYRVRLQLPPEVTCTQCIVQWTYTTGNRWGTCSNGTEGLGCGPQETFRACSDVSISSKGNPTQPTSTTTGKPPINPTDETPTTRRPRPTTQRPKPTTPRPKPTTQRPKPTTQRPKPTTQRPKPTTQRPKPTTHHHHHKPEPETEPEPEPEVEAPMGSEEEFEPEPETPPTVSTTAAPFVPGDSETGCRKYVPIGIHASIAGMESWCENNCRRGYCPEGFCRCRSWN